MARSNPVTGVDDAGQMLAVGLAMALAASGLTRQELARAMGVSTTHVTKIMLSTCNPSQAVVSAAARAVGYSVSELYRMGEQALARRGQRKQAEEIRRAIEGAEYERLVALARELGGSRSRNLIAVLEAFVDLGSAPATKTEGT